MKQLRDKLMGFGLAAVAGSALAADSNPQPIVPSVEPAPAVRCETAPRQIPAASLRIIPPSMVPSVEPAAAAATGSEPRKLPTLTVERIEAALIPNDEPATIVQASSPPQSSPPAINFTPSKVDRIDPLWFPSAKSGTDVPPASGPVQAGGSSGPAVIAVVPSSGPAVNAVVPSGGTGLGANVHTEVHAASIEPIAYSILATRPLAIRLLLPWLQADVNPETWPPAGPRVGLVPPDIVRCAIELPPVNNVPKPAAYWGPPGTGAAGNQPAPQTSWTPPKGAESQGTSTSANVLPLPTPLKTEANLPASVPDATVATPAAPAAPASPAQPQHVLTAPPTPSTPAPIALTAPPTSQTALPSIPAAQAQAVAPATPPSASLAPTATPSAVLPMPQPLLQPTTQPVASAPQLPAPNVELPQPRTLETGVSPSPAAATTASVFDLPTAPPELMVPEGTPATGKHSAFGSDPVRISHDYPSLWDICGTPIRERIEAGLVEDKPILNRGYVEAEFLMWWMSGMKVPPLATTTTSSTGMGFLGQPGTVPLIGPGTLLGSFREGLRVRAGYGLDECNTWGVDGSFFFLGQRDADAAYGSNQYGIITRPIYSPNTYPGTTTVIGEIGEAVSVPGILDGSLTVHSQSLLFGFDANLNRCLYSDCDSRATVFIGYRNLDLIESVVINENITVVGAGGTRVTVTDPLGTTVHVQDRFDTRNYFNGGQIGGTYTRQWNNFEVDARASIAFGATTQDLNISGFQTVTLPGQTPQTFRGGLLAVGPNLGDFTRNPFSVVPELTLNLGYWLTPSVKIYAGYNFLLWTDVIRAGDQIDRVVNLNYVPNGPTVGPSSLARPTALFNESNLIVHGVQFGVEWRW